MGQLSSRIRDKSAPAWVTVAPGIHARPMVEGDGCSIILYRIDPGNRFELHRHPFVELGVVLGGRGRIRVAHEERALREGDSFYLPSGTVHGFVVDGGRPVIMMNVTVPLSPDVSGPTSSTVLAIARDMARGCWDSRVVGPPGEACERKGDRNRSVSRGNDASTGRPKSCGEDTTAVAALIRTGQRSRPSDRLAGR